MSNVAVVPGICKGVKCMIKGCQNLSSHKVGELNPWDEETEKKEFLFFNMKHEHTAYLCDEHFLFVMTREQNYSMPDERFPK